MRYEILENGAVVNTVVATPEFMAEHFPLGAYRPATETAEPAPEPEWAWFIDIGPFTDRLGAASMAIDVSTDPKLVAIRSDFARRKWIDLKDPRVAGAVQYLAGQTHPVLGTLPQPLLTPAQAAAVLGVKPTPPENLALRKLYFGG